MVRTSCWTTLALMVSLGPSAALAGPDPLYGTGALNPEALVKTSDAELVVQVKRYLAHFKIEVVEKLDGQGGAKAAWSLADESTHDLKGLNRAERVALLALIRRAKTQGREADIYAPVSDHYVPVTIYWEEKTRIRLISGEAFPGPYGEAPKAEWIQETYGVGAFVDGDSAWDGKGLWVVAKALSLLSKDELAFLKGVPFHRLRADRRKRQQASYHRDDKKPRVEVYDSTFLFDREMFEGTVSQHVPKSVGVILHEVAHAIADHPMRLVLLEVQPLEQTFNESVAQEKAITEEYNALVKEANAATTRDQQMEVRKRLEGVNAKLRAKRAETRGLQKKANEQARRVTQADAAARRQGRPAEAALARVLSYRKAPTDYGRTNPSESFAESFRLYKDDPAGLGRIAPEALQWFQAGKHLEVIRKQVGK